MKLVKFPNSVIVNLDNLTHADFMKAFESGDHHYEAALTLNFAGDATPDVTVGFVGDDAERVWAYLVEQSYVMA